MKKIAIAIILLAVSASCSMADEGEQSAVNEPAKEVVKEVIVKTGALESVSGRVDSVIPADLVIRPRSKIVIIDDSGRSIEFIVKALAVIYDSTGRFLTLYDVRPGQRVQIEYITKANRSIDRADKIREAASIKILNK